MNKLRLLITADCNRSCKGCCNEVWNLDSLPKVTSFEGYKEILLTGGEPMLDPLKVLTTIQRIWDDVFIKPDIFMYTAKTKPAMELLMVLRQLTGITVSLHQQYDVPGFIKLQKLIKQHPKFHNKKLRLNVVSHVNTIGIDVEHWDVRYIEWVEPEDCPLPKDEVFARI